MILADSLLFGVVERRGGVDAVSRLRALAMRRVGGTGVLHHTLRNNASKPTTKRCAAEDVLLCTFCSFLAQGLGGWYAGIVNVEYFGEGVTCFLNKSRNENPINH